MAHDPFNRKRDNLAMRSAQHIKRVKFATVIRNAIQKTFTTDALRMAKTETLLGKGEDGSAGMIPGMTPGMTPALIPSLIAMQLSNRRV